jgi:hypothetical protein
MIILRTSEWVISPFDNGASPGGSIMKKLMICLGLCLALLVSAPFVGAEQNAAPEATQSVKEQTDRTAEASLFEETAPKKACPAALQMTPLFLPDNAEATPANPSSMLLPKICPVDCSPCVTPADCFIGGCKAIQCP